MNECRRRIGESIYYATDMYDAALDADALMLVTEWKEFRLPSWAVIKKTMEQPLVLDGRNIYDKKDMEEQGFTYHCIGKSSRRKKKSNKHRRYDNKRTCDSHCTCCLIGIMQQQTNRRGFRKGRSHCKATVTRHLCER